MKLYFKNIFKKPKYLELYLQEILIQMPPYYVINYDTSGKSDLVTSGKKNISQKTLNILKKYRKIQKGEFQ